MIIYVVTNTINGKLYVGQTIQLLNIRKSQHLYQTKLGSNKIFHSAIRKYGERAFLWEEVDDYSSIEDLNSAEELWIDELNTLSPNGYNLETGGKNHTISEETRLKMSRAKLGKKNHFYGRRHSEEAKKAVSISNKGTIHSDETKQKMSESTKGENHPMFGKHHTEESKQKMREKLSKQNMGKKNPFYGRKHSEKTKKKMGVSQKKRLAKLV